MGNNIIMGYSQERRERRALQDSLDVCNRRLKKICEWIDRSGEKRSVVVVAGCDEDDNVLLARLVAARVPVEKK